MAAMDQESVRRMIEAALAPVDRRIAGLESRSDHQQGRLDELRGLLVEAIPSHHPPPVAPPIPELAVEEEPGTIVLSPSRVREAAARFARCVAHWAWVITAIVGLLGTGSLGGIIGRELVAWAERVQEEERLEQLERGYP